MSGSLLAYSSKLGQRPFHAWARMPATWTLVTDDAAAPDEVARFRDAASRWWWSATGAGRFPDRYRGYVRQMTLLTVGAGQLELARLSSAGRASTTLHSGRRLRQTLIALTAGTRMSEHQSPGDATVLCLSGQVTLHGRERTVMIPEGSLVDAPPERHDLVADVDSLVILTVALG